MTDFSAYHATVNAYATEGGLDGRDQPATCYNASIALGDEVAPGDALGLWERYESLVDAAAGFGIRALRFDLSWARLEASEGVPDHSAWERYRQLITYAKSQGLTVGVHACDGAWPAWLGMEPWLWPWTTSITLRHLARVAEYLSAADSLDFFPDRTRLRQGFIDASGPPWRRGARSDAQFSEETLLSIRATALERALLRPVVGELRTRPLLDGVGPLRQSAALLAPAGDAWVLV